MKTFQARIRCVALLISICSGVSAQDPAATRALFPDANVVFTSYEKVLKLMKKNDTPVAESEYNIDLMMLTDKNSNMLSRYKVYHSGYSELVSLEAYTKVPAGKNKYHIVVYDFIHEVVVGHVKFAL